MQLRAAQVRPGEIDSVQIRLRKIGVVQLCAAQVWRADCHCIPLSVCCARTAAPKSADQRLGEKDKRHEICRRYLFGAAWLQPSARSFCNDIPGSRAI